MSIFYGYTCQNAQQNTSKAKLITKKIVEPDQVGFTPGTLNKLM
jgi:hypothetical protein